MGTILFWLAFLWAMLTGQLIISQSSSTNSEGDTEFSTEFSWPCLPYNDDREVCFMIIVDGEVFTGP
jgi:hypothetical protein